MSEIIKADFPEVYKDSVTHIIKRDRRYVYLEGGRAGGKTSNISHALAITLMNQPTLLCVGREFENTTADSVYRALQEAIRDYEMPGWQFLSNKMVNAEVRSQVIFKGLRTSKASGTLDAQRIKSLEGVNIFWGEEGQSFSSEALEVLIPTIREPNSMLIFTSNRVSAHDPVRKRLAEPLIGEKNLPDSNPFDDGTTFIQKINSWDIESYLPQEAIDERARLEALDPANFRHVWLGEPLTEYNGGIFSRQLAEARNQNRIGEYPYDSRYPTYAIFDLGTGDSTAVCLIQVREGAVYFIDYIEDFGRPTANYFVDINDKNYNCKDTYLPHDANNRSNRSSDLYQVEATTLVEDLEKMVPDMRFKVLPRNAGYEAIDLARGMFSTLYFDEKHCERLIECLEAYHYEWSEKNKILSKTPKHDWSSHGADAFQYACMAVNDIRKNGSNTASQPLKTYVPQWIREKK